MRVNLEYDGEFGEEEDFASLLEASEKRVASGGIQTGEIVEINDEYAMVSIAGEKLEAKLRLSEITKENGDLLFKVNDSIEVFVSQGRGGPNASYTKAQKMKKSVERVAQLKDNYKNKIIEAKVIKRNKGGFILEYDGMDVFMPRKDSAIKDDDKAIGKTYKVVIVNVDEENNSVIVSRKKFFEINDRQRKELSSKLLESSDAQKGIVKKITTFGIFVDVCGIEGLVHYTELSYKGPVNPSKKFQVGDEVMVKVLGYDEDKKRLSLSMKALGKDPWLEIEKELEVGYTVKVNVSNIEPYGAFVDLGNDIEGFLHISEISWDKNIKHPSNYISVGQEIDVEIIEIDTKNKKLRVSLKKLLDKPFARFAKTHQVGAVIKGSIATLTDFGAFVNLGIVDGLLHNEDAFWDSNLKCKDEFKVGDEVELEIVKIDKENERISLSKRALSDSPARDFAKSHKVDDIVKSVATSIKDFGIFVKIDSMEALIRNEDIYPLNKEEINVGDEIECVISYIDVGNNRVRASVKRLERRKEKEKLKAFNSEEKMTLGDKLKNRL